MPNYAKVPPKPQPPKRPTGTTAPTTAGKAQDAENACAACPSGRQKSTCQECGKTKTPHCHACATTIAIIATIIASVVIPTAQEIIRAIANIFFTH